MNALTLQKTDLKSRKQRICLCLLASIGILLVVGMGYFVAPLWSVKYDGFHFNYGRIRFPSTNVSSGLIHVGVVNNVYGRTYAVTLKLTDKVWGCELWIGPRERD